jgi:hypothetical protein
MAPCPLFPTNRSGAGVDWDGVVEGVMALVEPLAHQIPASACVVVAELSKAVVRVLNALLATLPPRSRRFLYYQLVRRRATLEAWRRQLESCMRNSSTSTGQCVHASVSQSALLAFASAIVVGCRYA